MESQLITARRAVKSRVKLPRGARYSWDDTSNTRSGKAVIQDVRKVSCFLLFVWNIHQGKQKKLKSFERQV